MVLVIIHVAGSVQRLMRFICVGINVKTGEIFPSTFPHKGPEIPLRMARQLTGGQQVSSLIVKSTFTCILKVSDHCAALRFVHIVYYSRID